MTKTTRERAKIIPRTEKNLSRTLLSQEIHPFIWLIPLLLADLSRVAIRMDQIPEKIENLSARIRQFYQTDQKLNLDTITFIKKII